MVNSSKIQERKEPQEIMVIDIETTGTDPYFDSIIEIGACKLNLNTGTIEPLFDVICQEEDKDLHEDAWIFYHSDLKYVDVINSPDLSEYRKELQALFDKYHVTAYNQDFDFTFLEMRGFEISNKFWDPLLKFTDLLKIPYNEWEYKWPSIQESWYYFFPGIPLPTLHRALADSIMEALMISEYHKQFPKKTLTFDEVLAKMDELGVKICGYPDMEEQYCTHYEYEIKEIGTGGYCTCKRNCDSCHSKKWNDDLCLPVDKAYLIRQKEEAMKKPVQRVNQRTTLDNWSKFIEKKGSETVVSRSTTRNPDKNKKEVNKIE